MKAKIVAVFVFAVLGTLLGERPALAAPVPVTSSPDGPGKSVYDVLHHYYSAQEVGPTIAYWQSQQVSTTELWSALSGSAGFIAKAKYAGDTHDFGWISNPTTSPVFHPLFTDGPDGYISGVFGTVSVTNPFAWAILDHSTGLWSSYTPANPDGYDHMVAYKLSTPGKYVLAFEDLWYGGDKDFNDLVVEASSVCPAPEPASLILAATGVSVLAGWGYRRRRAVVVA